MREELTVMIARAEQFDTALRAAAWLRIARVLAAIDHAAADRLLEPGAARALAVDRALPAILHAAGKYEGASGAREQG